MTDGLQRLSAANAIINKVRSIARFFPSRYVLERRGQVYGHDADARERSLTPEERLQFHQAHSGPVMEQLHHWLEAQFAERKTEPNSGWARRSGTYCDIGGL